MGAFRIHIVSKSLLELEHMVSLLHVIYECLFNVHQGVKHLEKSMGRIVPMRRPI